MAAATEAPRRGSGTLAASPTRAPGRSGRAPRLKDAATTALRAIQQMQRGDAGAGPRCGRRQAETYLHSVYGSALKEDTRRPTGGAARPRAATGRPQWRLEITVVNAAQLLPKADDVDAASEATSHCFCTVAYGGSVRHTDIYPATLAPGFDTRLTFPLRQPEIDAPLKVILWTTALTPVDESASPTQHRPKPKPSGPKEDTDGDSDGADQDGAEDKVHEDNAHEDDAHDGAWAHAGATQTAEHAARAATAPVPYSAALAADARFLGQVLLKPLQVETAIGAAQTIVLPLQKRTPRSKVRGSVAVRLSRSEVDPGEAAPPDESQYHQVDPETLPSDDVFAWRAPAAWATPTLHFWRVAHDLLLFEASCFEDEAAAAISGGTGERLDASSNGAARAPPLACSVACCHVLRSLGTLPGCNANQAVPYLLEEYVTAVTGEREIYTGTEWAQLVALLSFLWQTAYADVGAEAGGGSANANTNTNAPTRHKAQSKSLPAATATTLASTAATGSQRAVGLPQYSKAVAEQLRRLLDAMQTDLEQYKFQFAAHRHVAPALFSSTLVAFVTAQRILRVIDNRAEAPALRLERSLAACKARVFDLIAASAAAEARDVMPRKLLIMAEMVEEEVRYDLVYFAGPLRHFGRVDAIRLNVQTLVSWLASHAEESLTQSSTLAEADVSAFDLLRKLRTLRDKFVRPVRLALRGHGLEVTAFDGLHAWFLPHVEHWLTDASRRGSLYAARAIQLDTLQPMTEAVLHSSSAFDLMTFLMQTYYELAALRWEDPPTAGAIFQLLAELAVDTAKQYSVWAMAMATRSQAELPTAQRCVVANNLAQLSTGIADLCKQVERHLVKICDDAAAAVAEAAASTLAASGQGMSESGLLKLTKRYAARFRRQRRPEASDADDDPMSLAELEMQLLIVDDAEDPTSPLTDDENDSDSNSDSNSDMSSLVGSVGSEISAATTRRSSDAASARRRNSAASSLAHEAQGGQPRQREHRSTSISIVRPGNAAEQLRLDEMTPRPAAALGAIESTTQTFNLAQEELSGGLLPVLHSVCEPVMLTLEQYMTFLLGLRRSKPSLSQAFLLQRRKGQNDSAATDVKFGPSKVAGMSERKMDKVKRRLEKLMRSRRASWHRQTDRVRERDRSDTASSDSRLQSQTKARAAALELELSSDDVRESLGPLLEFLDDTLQLLSDNLYEGVFQQALSMLWEKSLQVVHAQLSPRDGSLLSASQSTILLQVMSCLQRFFRAGGEGLGSDVLEAPAYANLVEQLRLCRNSTLEIMDLYHRCQAEKVLGREHLRKPSISYAVQLHLDGTRLHLNDKLIVIVRECANLPPMGLDGTTNARVVVTARLQMGGGKVEVEQQMTPIVEGNVHPHFNSTLTFRVPSLTGLLHLAVYHVDRRHNDFVGEATCTVDPFESDDVRELHFEQPLTQQLSRQAYTLLGVLAARRGDEEAQNFVTLRMGEIAGRTSAGLKLHIVHGHHFHARHYTLPPVCAVCAKLIVGLGKAVYRCEACGAMCHKACHIAIEPCRFSSKA